MEKFTPIPGKRYTAADYRTMPEGPPYYQLIDGHLLREPSPTPGHQDIIGGLYMMLAPWAKRSGAGKVFLSPLDVWLTDRDIVQPDLLFVSKGRMRRLEKDGIHGGPDIVVEVLSPSTRRLDRTVKRDLYRREGVRELWLVDSERREIVVHRLSRRREFVAMVFGADDRISSPLLPGLEIEIAAVFET